MSMEIILIFRQINKIAKFLNLECIPRFSIEGNDNYISIVNYGMEYPWKHYIQFRVSGSFINVISIDDIKTSNRTGLNTAQIIKSVSLGDPQFFAKISETLKDWSMECLQNG